MQKPCKLILDTFCEVYDLLKPWADGEFWDFESHNIVPGAIYLISRKEFQKNLDKIKDLARDNQIHVFLSNPHEGSETLRGQCKMYGIEQLILDKKVLLIGGGDMEPGWPCLQYDSFLPKILDYDENISASQRSNEIYTKTVKPYKFLFLNGRMRPHRKYLIEKFGLSGLLDQSIWTILDSRDSASRKISLLHQGHDLMKTVRPVKYLDPVYEFDFYQKRIGLPSNDAFVKNTLFDHTWGEIYLKAEPYIDTYFSVVTETVFEYPYSFRTEKIWKPMAMAHPWIVVSNAGYYRDLKRLGYRTFSHLIDERFDLIENNQDRIEYVGRVIEDLCAQDLTAFLAAAQEICKYNQQLLAEHRLQVRQDFPKRFFQFVNNYIS